MFLCDADNDSIDIQSCNIERVYIFDMLLHVVFSFSEMPQDAQHDIDSKAELIIGIQDKSIRGGSSRCCHWGTIFEGQRLAEVEVFF